MTRPLTPTVSVIVPTHNRSHLLQRAVRSVLRQSFADFEILVCDDASSDDTADVVGRFADDRVRYVRLGRNQGVAAARNAGIAAAHGLFIALLDDDDEWLPEKLARQMALFSQAGDALAAVYCGHVEVEEQTGRAGAEGRPFLRGRIYERMLIAGRLTPTSAMIVRASCLADCGGFDQSFEYGEDFDLWLRIARRYEIDFVDEPLIRVYFQPTGLTRNYRAIVSGTERYLRRHEDFFRRHPDLHAAQLQRLGTFYCFAGETARGRAAFLKAIGLNPRSPKNYACLALSFLGGDLFRASYLAKDRLRV